MTISVNGWILFKDRNHSPPVSASAMVSPAVITRGGRRKNSSVIDQPYGNINQGGMTRHKG